MLYVTTRDDRDAFTVSHPMTKSKAGDGGLFVPFRMPRFSEPELSQLMQMPMNQRMAEILNLLCGLKLNGWDVDFAVGRKPVRFASIHHRIVVCEVWHNLHRDFAGLLSELAGLIKEYYSYEAASEWMGMAVRIAVLFGGVGDVYNAESTPVDLAVKDISWMMAARYAKQLGLPVGNVVVCCDEDDLFWEFIHRGELQSDIPGIERLIHQCGGAAEVHRYLDAMASGSTYFPGEMTLQKLQAGMVVSVVSPKRVASSIPNVFRVSGKVLDPDSAMAYCGLQDYRSQTGESRTALIVSDHSPIWNLDMLAAVMSMTKLELMQLLDEM